MRHFLKPDEVLKCVYDIDIDKLRVMGYRYMLLDLDNTLLPWNSCEVRGELKDWLCRLSDAGFSCVIVSNNSHPRVQPVAKQLGIPFVENANKPLRSSVSRAMKLAGARTRQTLMVGDQLVTDIWAGKTARLYTILVSPLCEKEHAGTKINRWLERMLLKRMGVKRP